MKTICFVLLPFCLTLAVSYADGQREQTGQSDLVLTRLRVPQDFPTIQAAIDAAHHGDTVLVSEGTYYENIRYRGKAITVGSLYVIDGDTTHIARTIIDGSRSTQPDSGSVVSFITGEDTTSVLCGFTITGGAGTRHLVQLGDFWVHWYRAGGGVFCDSAGARLTRNIITRNRVVAPNAFGGGVGAITISPSLVPFVVLEANLITDNYVQADSAVDASLGGGAFLGGVEPRVLENVFERDTVIGRGIAAGGGVRFCGYGWRGSPYTFPNGAFVGNVFRSNVARATQVGVVGAGLELEFTGEVTIQDNLFESNAATCVGTSPDNWAHGGGLYTWDNNLAGAGRKMIINNQFLNNTVVCPQWAIGGGMELQRSLGTVSGNNFRSNTATGTGFAGDAAGGGLSISEVPVEGTVVEKNKFIDNYVQHATFASGGAIRLCYARATVRANEMVGNTATGGTAYGGGIQIFQSAARVENNIIRGNSSKNYGGGIAVDSPPAYGTGQVLVNNTVCGNSSSVGGGLLVTGGANVVSFNNIFWANSATAGSIEIYVSGAAAEVRYCDVEGGYFGAGNIDADPVFVSGDPSLNLAASSPCVGGGVGSIQVGGVWQNAPPNDFDNRVRPMPLGTSPDMGAQEEQITTASASIGASPWSINFGSVPVGRSSDTSSVKLRNISTHTVIIDSITLHDTQFSLINLPTLPVSLMASDSMAFRTLFHPTARGITTREIVVTTRGTLDRDVFVPLQGEGLLLGPEFLLLVDRVTAAPYPERSALVDSFMASNPVLPFIEDTIAQFIYRGPATSVNVPGDLNGWSTGEDAMKKLSTTDLWYLPCVFERDARLDYKFFLNRSTWIIDPLNPIRTAGGFGDNSTLEMPAYIPPWEIRYDATIQHGRSEFQSIHSNIRGVIYSVRVYLPYGYDGSTGAYPSAYFQDGGDYVNFGNAINVLDNSIARSKIKPIIGVFVTPTNRGEEYAFTLRNQYQEFFVTELVPFIDSVYRTITSPSERAVIGDSYGGNISALISYNHPEVFGNCGLQSAAFAGNEAYNLIVNGLVKPIDYYSVWGTYSDVAYNMRPFRDAMIEKGYFFRWEERHEGHSWGQWCATIDTILQTFFPQPTGDIAERQVLPTDFRLAQNYPNPFNPSTTIRYALPSRSHVTLSVYNTLGQKVRTLVDKVVDAGYQSVEFDASGLASGVYLYRLQAGSFVQTKRMLILR